MTTYGGWYDIVTDVGLEQADLLKALPIPRVETFQFPVPDVVDVTTAEEGVLILTQSCDLVNEHVNDVLVAAVLDYDGLVAREADKNAFVASKRWRQSVVRGDVAAYSLLPPHSDAPTLGWSLIDFHHLFTVPREYLTAFAGSCGPRLRVLPPYREHIAQAFARYIMRVGLPLPLVDFEAVILK